MYKRLTMEDTAGQGTKSRQIFPSSAALLMEGLEIGRRKPSPGKRNVVLMLHTGNVAICL